MNIIYFVISESQIDPSGAIDRCGCGPFSVVVSSVVNAVPLYSGIQHIHTLMGLLICDGLDSNWDLSDQITDRSLILLNVPALDTLVLESCPRVGDNAVEHLIVSSCELTSLTVAGCPMFSDRSMMVILGLVCMPLTSLDLSGAVGLSSHWFCTYAESFPHGHLHTLDISFNLWVDDLVMSSLTLLPIRTLVCCECESITMAGWRHLQGLTNSLTSLSVRNNSLVNDASLAELASLRLKTLILTG